MSAAHQLRITKQLVLDYPRGAIVLHGGDESYWLDEKIIAVPWWRVM
jgi:hypothetical protein